MSQREKAKTYNSLIILLKGLETRVTTIDLRNECAVRGIVNTVDAEMNCQMSKVCFRSADGKEQRFDDFYVKGPNIRYVHIPDDMDILSTIKNQLDLHTGARARGVKSQRRKMHFNVGAERRATRKQTLERKMAETRKMIEEQKEKLQEETNP